MNICLLVFTDGRGEYLEPTLDSFAQNVSGSIIHSILIDDSANESYANWLDARYKDWFTQIVHHETRRGFVGAVQSGWDNLPDCDFVFHLEDDFTFNAKVNLDELAQVLTAFPYLAQIVLKRQPVNESEKQAGGIGYEAWVKCGISRKVTLMLCPVKSVPSLFFVFVRMQQRI